MICGLPFLNKLHIMVSHLAMHTVQREFRQGSVGTVSKTLYVTVMGCTVQPL
ncbi:hypothetical protein I79_016764 [Cricetulus griseus]|uniref:Uncharacterized protein n=1 Tax=Cricetulus griseus TaxID=10029 RepID=G3I087_CRIGR|nr:hypothetical protein I79_016764 [Cricetulus griseus]